MNAAALADGWLAGGAASARVALDKFWQRISHAAAFSPLQRSPLDRLMGRWTLDTSPAYIIMDVMSRFFSPYDLNPLGFDPLRIKGSFPAVSLPGIGYVRFSGLLPGGRQSHPSVGQDICHQTNAECAPYFAQRHKRPRNGQYALCARTYQTETLPQFRSPMTQLGHVWTAPTGQGFLLAFCLRSGASHVYGLFVRR